MNLPNAKVTKVKFSIEEWELFQFNVLRSGAPAENSKWEGQGVAHGKMQVRTEKSKFDF